MSGQARWRHQECQWRAQRLWATTTTTMNIDRYIHVAVKVEDYCSQCRTNSILGLPMYLLS